MKYSTTINNETIAGDTIDELISHLPFVIDTNRIQKHVVEIKDDIQKLDPSLPIVFEENNDQYLLAHLEYGRHHGRPYHKISYKSSYPFWQHPVVHELMHLEMYIKASNCNRGMMFKKGAENDAFFKSNFGMAFKRLIPKVGEDGAKELQRMVQNGIITQLLSSPLDLFVEQRIYDRYHDFRLLQFRSLLNQEQTNIGQYKTPIVKLFPPKIVSANKILCLVGSLHFKDFFNLDFITEYKATKQEIQYAHDFYEEFKEYLNTYSNADEYELYEYFAESLGIKNIVNLVKE